jgi:hypothetical protein
MRVSTLFVGVIVLALCVLPPTSHVHATVETQPKHSYDFNVNLWGFVKSGTTYTVTLIGRAVTLLYDTPGGADTASLEELARVREAPMCGVSLQEGMRNGDHCCVWWAEIQNCRSSAGERVMPRFSLDKHAEFQRICDADYYKGQPECHLLKGVARLPLSPHARANDRHLLLVRDPRDVMVSWFYYVAYNKEILHTGPLRPQLLHAMLGARNYSMAAMLPVKKHDRARQQQARAVLHHMLQGGYKIDDAHVAPILLFLVNVVVDFYINNYQSLRLADHFHVAYYGDMDAQPERELAAIMRFLGYSDISAQVVQAAAEYSSMTAMKSREIQRSQNHTFLDVARAEGRGEAPRGYKLEGLVSPDTEDPRAFKSRKGGSGGYAKELSPSAQRLVLQLYAAKLPTVRSPLWRFLNGTDVKT